MTDVKDSPGPQGIGAIDRRTFIYGATAVAAGTLLPGAARSQGSANYPNQIVRIVVPFSGGSMTDILARSIAEKLSAKWGQQVIVENKPGIAGTSSVAKGQTDGYVLMLTSNGHSVINAVSPNANFDAVKDFAGITKVASTPAILVVPPEFPAKTLKDFIDAAKAQPGKLSYSSAGRGSSTGIAAELFRSLTGTEMALVPFRGMPESQTSVMRNDTQMTFTFFNVGGDLVQSGKLKALAVTGAKRMPQLPDVPTFAEAGLPQFTYDAWFGVMAPVATPKPIIEKVHRDIAEALKAPDLLKRFETQGVVIESNDPANYDKMIAADAAAYGKLAVGG